jgi:hypothetical protein
MNEISTAIPLFSGSPVSTDATPTSTDFDQRRKYNMAADKPEVIVSHFLDLMRRDSIRKFCAAKSTKPY